MSSEMVSQIQENGALRSKEMPADKERNIRIETRELQSSDLSTIKAILLGNIVQARPDTEDYHQEYSEVVRYLGKMIESLGGGNERKYTVATIENLAVGILGYAPLPLCENTHQAMQASESFIPLNPVAQTAELYNFYVDPTKQRQGIGGKLWQEVHKKISDDPRNFQAIAFISTRRHEEMWPWYTGYGGYTQGAETEHLGHKGRVFYKPLYIKPPEFRDSR